MDYLQIANSWPVWLCAGACVAFIVVQAVAFAKLCYKNAPLVGLSKADCSKSFKCGMVTAIGPSLSCFIGALGTILTITGVITTLVLPIASDRSKSKKRKPIVLVCEIGTLVGLVLIITGHTVGLQILMACCLGIFLTGVTPIVMVLGYESAYPVSEGTTESLMQLGANGWGLICLLAVNGIFQGNHMGTLVFFLAGTVLSLVLTMMIKEASLKERRIE